MWNYAQCYVPAWIGGGFEGEWIHVFIYMAESLLCSPETTTALLIGYTLIQIKSLQFENKYRKKKKKRILEWVAISTPEDLPDLEIKPMSLGSPALSGRCFSTVPRGKPLAHNGVIVLGGQPRDSAVYVHVSILSQTPLPSRVPHNTE